mgnify:CR=1 FL=1
MVKDYLEGRFEVNTEDSLVGPKFALALFDEMEKALPSVTTKLLSVLAERKALHGNKVIEVDGQGKVVWKVTNEDVGGLFKDPCGAQRLANGNTVVGSHGASSGIFLVEVNRDRKIVWTSQHPAATAVHSFQILTTNGVPEPGMPQK